MDSLGVFPSEPQSSVSSLLQELGVVNDIHDEESHVVHSIIAEFNAWRRRSPRGRLNVHSILSVPEERQRFFILFSTALFAIRTCESIIIRVKVASFFGESATLLQNIWIDSILNFLKYSDISTIDRATGRIELSNGTLFEVASDWERITASGDPSHSVFVLLDDDVAEEVIFHSRAFLEDPDWHWVVTSVDDENVYESLWTWDGYATFRSFYIAPSTNN